MLQPILFVIFSLFCAYSELIATGVQIEELFPIADRCIIALEELHSGHSHRVTKCTTALGNHYALREPKILGNKERFCKVAHVMKRAAELFVSPCVYGINDVTQQVLMDYIPSMPWCSCDQDIEPYIVTMHVLRHFHDAMRAESPTASPQQFQPFAAILAQEKQLVMNQHMPRQVQVAFNRMKMLYAEALPWLQQYATVYHGDLKVKNVLIQKEDNHVRAWLIDFEYAAIGHPYFDVVKFLQKLPVAQHMCLLREYLGHEPHAEELRQLAIAHNALRLLIALLRFDHAFKVAGGTHTMALSKEEMEAILQSPEPLPSQATVLLSNPDSKVQLMGALYALDDFLRNSEHYCACDLQAL